MISILSLCALFSCAKNQRLAKNMTSFSYSIQGMVACGERYTVSRDGDSAVVEVQFFYEKNVTQKVDPTIFNDLQAIIDRHKVQKYQKSYLPGLQILDGEMWDLTILYENSEQNIYSHGSNAWPQRGGEALKEFKNYFHARFLKE